MALIKIESISHEGLGVGHHNGMTFFVEKAIPEDIVTVEVTKQKPRFCFAKIINFNKVSPLSVEPSNKYDSISGGAPLARLKYTEQLKHKTNILKNAFLRIGKLKLDGSVWKPIIGMNNPNRYRNKARYACKLSEDGNIRCGSYMHNSNTILFEKDSIIYKAENKYILQEIEYFAKNKSSFNTITEITIRTTSNNNQMIIFEGSNKPKELNELSIRLTQKFTTIKSIIWQQKIKKTFSHLEETIFSKDKIIDFLADFKFNISANTFFQINHEQTTVIYNTVKKFANLTGTEIIWDLYCGVGTISLWLSKKAKLIRGTDISKASIKSAKLNAETNQTTNVFFEEGSANHILPKWQTQFEQPDIIVLDPPRSGCDPIIISTLLKISPTKIIYVSCNPATLARDISKLSTQYVVKYIQPVDMFPHTAHIEIVVLMTKENK